MPDTAITHRPIATLTPWARNARTHSKKQIRQIAASIQQFGFTNPVLIDEAGTILAGHGRVAAAQLLGMTEVPCLRLDHMTEDEKRAYVLADMWRVLGLAWSYTCAKSGPNTSRSGPATWSCTGARAAPSCPRMAWRPFTGGERLVVRSDGVIRVPDLCGTCKVVPMERCHG